MAHSIVDRAGKRRERGPVRCRARHPASAGSGSVVGGTRGRSPLASFDRLLSRIVLLGGLHPLCGPRAVVVRRGNASGRAAEAGTIFQGFQVSPPVPRSLGHCRRAAGAVSHLVVPGRRAAYRGDVAPVPADGGDVDRARSLCRLYVGPPKRAQLDRRRHEHGCEKARVRHSGGRKRCRRAGRNGECQTCSDGREACDSVSGQCGAVQPRSRARCDR
jgi:hypothetical protein